MIPIATPYVSDAARRAVAETLLTRWIGQGPKVDEFEAAVCKKFDLPGAVAVNSGTSALELAYDLAGIGKDTPVVVPVLTCMATTLPLIRRGARIIFADIERDTLTIDWSDVQRKMPEGGWVVPVSLHGVMPSISPHIKYHCILDAAQSFGAFREDFDFVSYSFQAIKQVTTGDGGMLATSKTSCDAARLLRWFGIDRAKKRDSQWEPFNERDILTYDIEMAGYKFQMTDIAAAMGLAHLAEYDAIMAHRKAIFDIYARAGLPLVDGIDNYYCYACLLVGDRPEFRRRMHEARIETSVMHVRNDRYKICEPYRSECPNMDWIESRYVCIPLHNQLTIQNAEYIAEKAVEALKR